MWVVEASWQGAGCGASKQFSMALFRMNAVAVAVALSVGLAACGGDVMSAATPRPVLEAEVYEVDPSSLNVVVAICEPEGVAIDVEEAADVVTVTARAEGGEQLEGCGHSSVVGLAEPLGDRDVNDSATGEPVLVFRFDEDFPPPPGIPAP